MKVKELIEQLQKLPPDADLYIPQPEWWEGDTRYVLYEGGPGAVPVKFWTNDYGEKVFQDRNRARKDIDELIVL